MSVQIFPFTIGDFDEVTAFWRGVEGVGLNESDERGPIADYLARNPGMSFVARDGGRVVGAVLCGHDGRRGYLHHLAVAASYRGQGLGRTLVERCLAELSRAGIRRCNLYLYADNPEGRKFWEAVGFKERGDLRVLQRPIGSKMADRT